MNQKAMPTGRQGFASLVIIIGIVVLGGLAAYAVFVLPSRDQGESPVNGAPADWQSIDADSFTLSLPSSWQFNKLQGIDSYVGEFTGEGAKLTFDFGLYGGPPRETDDIVITAETIHGYEATIVMPKVVGTGRVGVYFGNLGNQNRFAMYGNNFTSSQQETALRIFRTIRFKENGQR